MPFIRRTLKAALWGVPGPVVAAILIAVAWAWFCYHSQAPVGSFEKTLPRMAQCWWVMLAEAICGVAFGFLYSLARSRIVLTNGKWGTFSGAVVGAYFWGLPAIPFLMAGETAAILFWIYQWTSFHHALAVLAAFIAHVLGGAIAGFHVEYYLLHGREPD